MRSLNSRDICLDQGVHFNANLKSIRKSYPYHNWNGYLKWQAEQGNKTALNVLRSKAAKKNAAEVDQVKPSRHEEEKQKKSRQIRIAFLDKERQIIMSSVHGKRRNGLVAIIRMQQLEALEHLRHPVGMEKDRGLFSGVRHTIDNNGTVIFTLAGGGTIRDTGRKIYYSQDEATKKAAMIYSQVRLGKNIQLTGNSIERKPYERNNSTGHHKSYPAVLGQISKNRLRSLSELDVVRIGKVPEVLLPGHARIDLER